MGLNSHAIPTAVPKEGDNRITFATPPTGWKVGDRLVFAGLNSVSQVNQRGGIDPVTGSYSPIDLDEERTIKSISPDGRSFTLDQALAYQHGGIYGYPEAVPVGNLSRNVRIESEHHTDVPRRGHVMFMHTQDVVVDSAQFRELGRTEGRIVVTDPKVRAGIMEKGTDGNTPAAMPFISTSAPA